MPAGEQPQQAPGGLAASVEDQLDAVRLVYLRLVCISSCFLTLLTGFKNAVGNKIVLEYTSFYGKG